MAGPTGPACASLPTEGEGSVEGMADDPAATAASNNPELSTLVAAVDAAELVDTLNGEGPFTIFAPANSAFAKIPQADLDALLADPQGALTDILTLHVVQGEQLSSADLVAAGTATAIAGDLTDRRRRATRSRSTPAVDRRRSCAPTCRRRTPPCTSSTRCSLPPDRREPCRPRGEGPDGSLAVGAFGAHHPRRLDAPNLSS